MEGGERTYNARVKAAREAWAKAQEEARAAGRQGVSMIKPPESPDVGALSEEAIWAAYNAENYGDADLTRALLRGKWLRDALTVKENGEGGDYYRWDGRYWAPDTYSELMDALRPLADAYRRLAEPIEAKIEELKEKRRDLRLKLSEEQAKTNPDNQAIANLENQRAEATQEIKLEHDKLKPIDRRAKGVCLRPRLKNAINMAFSAREMQQDGLHWNQKEHLLPCLNGTIDLKYGMLLESKPGDYFNRMVPWEFKGLDAPCPFFKEMVWNIMCRNEGRYEYFLDTLASCLIGKQEKALYLWLGPKANNGKSTLSDLMMSLLGVDGGFCVDFNIANYLYCGPKDAERPAAGLLQLMGARCAISGEPGNQDYLDLGKTKKLSSGGDSINARTLNSPTLMSFKQTQTPIIHCNAIPQCNGADAGLKSRMRAIPFEAQFLTAEQMPKEGPSEEGHIYPAMEKGEIASQLREEMSGILAEMVRRCMKIYCGQRAPIPPEVLETGENYVNENDRGLQYLSEMTEPAPGHSIHGSTLYNDFRDWCTELAGIPPSKVPNRMKFGMMMKAHLGKERRMDGWYYLDIAFPFGRLSAKEMREQREAEGVC